MDSSTRRPRTRIQTEKRELILQAALEMFSAHGFRGATVDEIADAAGMSKPNLLYYFRNKEEIHGTLMQRLLDTWLAPLRELDDIGDPMTELRSYIRRKLEMARDYPRESRLFANEILQGAPRVLPMLEGELRSLVDEKVGGDQGLDARRQDRPHRPLPSDLFDLGDHPALCRFRRAGPRRTRPRPGR